MRSPLRRDLLHPCVFDAPFLAEQKDLLPKPIDLRLQPDSGVDAVRGDAAGVGQGVCAKEIVWMTAERTRRGQPFGSGICESAGLVNMCLSGRDSQNVRCRSRLSY